jgi:DNA-binding transcriptional MocR family regulator
VSPIQAMDRSYATLKRMLCEGRFSPGHRLEANRLADELGVSMTPVRDVLHRLVGERLVEASSGEGFHVPRLAEKALRDLYEWNAALLSIAARTMRRPIPDTDTPPLWRVPQGADRIAALFARLGAGAPNAEVGAAIGNASDRLHPYRMVEPLVLAGDEHELDELASSGPAQAQAIRRYHLRRMKHAAGLIEAREQLGAARL